MGLRKALIQESIRRVTAPSLIEELKDLLSKKRAYIVPLIYIVSALSIGSSYYDMINGSYNRSKKTLSIIDVFMDPHAMLVDGLHAYQQPYYQQIAFLELWRISNFDHNRRKAIYADFNRKVPFNCASHNNPTSAWAEISRVCMDFILGLARSAQDGIKAQQQRKVMLRNKYELFKKLIEASRKQKHQVKKAKKSLEVGVTAETMTKDREYWEMKSLEWFHPTAGSYPLFVRKVYCYIAVPFLKRSVERRTRDLLTHLLTPDSAALATLTRKSLSEDEHGIVQNDISNVFGAIIDCLLSLERYAEEPPLDDWDMGDPFSPTSSKVLADPLIVINALGQEISYTEGTRVETTNATEREDEDESAERVSDLIYDPNRAQSDETLLNAQNQILQTIANYKQPSPNRAVTGLSSQYLFGYPLWALRTRHQSGLHDTPQQDTLLAYWKYLLHTGKRKGFDHLWNGFITRIACQTLMVMYESSLEIAYDRIAERQNRKSARMTTYIVLKG
ncbi:11590_t:CDS:2, partial [Acaulospora colombiana]